jgi:hypothetical protein
MERTRAKYREGDSPQPAAIDKDIATVDELLLENGTVIFQCAHPAAEDCVYTNERAMKVTAHQAAHSAAYRLRQTERKLAEVESELNERKRRRSEGSTKGAETRRSKRLAVPIEAGHYSKPDSDLTDLESGSRRVVAAYNAMQDAIDEFQRVFIGYMRLAATASNVTPDPEVLAKAEKWDKYLEFQAFVSAPTPNGTVNTPTTSRRAPRRTGNGL